MIGRHEGASTSRPGWKSEEVGELAGPEAAAPARSEVVHREEVPGAADQLVFAARYGEVLEAGARFSAEVVQRPH